MKILWVKSDFLYPADTGGKIRSYNILKQLSAQHEVSYLCLTDEIPSDSALRHVRDLGVKVEWLEFRTERKFSPAFYAKLFFNLFSPRPYVINKYRDKRITAKIREYIARDRIDVIVCDFLEMAINMMDIRGVPKVLFQHNVETEIWRRHFEVAGNPLKKAYLYVDFQKFYNFEKLACSKFDDVLVVSESDGDLLQKTYGVRHTTLIPTGVDIEYFHPQEDRVQPANIVFVGSMDWLPNQDAVKFFVDDIYPLVKSCHPEAKLYLVGRRPPDVIKALEKIDNSITVTGTVDDIRPFVDQAQVYVVPIRIGGGTRIKIFEAMAQKKAIVSTTVGAEGLPVSDNREIIIKDKPREFAEAVCQLIDDAKLNEKISRGGYRLVTGKYSWEKIAVNFSEALEKVINHHPGPRPVSEIAGES